MVSGIGAADNVVLGIYDTSGRVYNSTMIEGDHEITNLTGNISQMDNDVYLHIHATLSDAKNFTIGGHLTSAVISGACEIFITALDAHITRVFDDKTGLNILKL
jgi:predicted DNA-binding protein with PD1-like motif